MPTALITGSTGLIGAEAVRFFGRKGHKVVGIDNDMRQFFFGPEASTRWSLEKLKEEVKEYHHRDIDIRDESSLERVFQDYQSEIDVIIHTAAQPSHDWAAKEPKIDFTVNANGTLNLLEQMRKFCPKACFIFTSTNKVYGDTPNFLPLIEKETRWEIDEAHPYFAHGIDEKMSIDHSMHSLFGVSKTAADLLVQEYGRYFGLNTACFRGGCLTGPNHSGAPLHGFLAYLMKCALTHTPYTVHGYKGKQVRDNIHAFDLVNMFWHFYQKPRSGVVYNAGGSRHSNCSMKEAIELCESISGNKMKYEYSSQNRQGDHIWWISDVRKFQEDYPEWKFTYDLPRIVEEIYGGLKQRALP